VGIGPPKVLAAPNPVSSVMMSRTFGAPAGAVTDFGKSGVDSLVLRPITPPNCGRGIGSTAEPPSGVVPCASAELDSAMQPQTVATIAALSYRCLDEAISHAPFTLQPAQRTMHRGALLLSR